MEIVNGNLTKTFHYGMYVTFIFILLIVSLLIFFTYIYRPDFIGMYNDFLKLISNTIF